MDIFAFLILLAIAIGVSGPVAFVLTLRMRGRMQALRTRVEYLESDLHARRVAARTQTTRAPATPDAETPDVAKTDVAKTETPTAAAEAHSPPAPSAPVAASVTPAPAASWWTLESTEGEATRAAAPLSAPSRSLGLERIVGTNWTVWLGGLTLAFGGLLLVRYSMERGLVGPGVRCAMGLALAIGLAAAGEWLRRRERRSDVATPTPSILTAAGTVVAFGAIYAAHGLYGFIGPAFAFVALGLVAVGSIIGAALHGPTLAGVGLVGAFVAPLIVNSSQPNPWPVVLYLAVATGAAYVLSRIRRWLWLARAASLGAAAWSVLFAINGSATFLDAALVHTIVAAALASVFIAFLPNLAVEDTDANVDPEATAIFALFTGACAFVVVASIDSGHFGLTAIVLVGLFVVTLAGTAAVTAAAVMALPIAAAFVLAVLVLWPGDPEKLIRLSTLVTFKEALQPTRFALLALFGTVAVCGVAVRRLLSGPALRLPLTAICAATATVSPLLVLAEAWLRLAGSETSPPFTAFAGLLAAVFALLAHRCRDGAAPDAPLSQRLVLGAFATGALAAVALGLVFVLDGGMLTVALALSALAAAAIAARLEVGGLRLAVAAMGFVVLGRIAWEPRIVGDTLGATPILNWLLIGYGVPALAFGVAARIMRLSGGEDLPVRVAQSLAILFGALLGVFEIRHLLNAGNVYAQMSDFAEWGLYATTSLLFSLVLMKLDLRRAAPVFEKASLVFGALSAPIVLIGLVGVTNPFFTCQAVAGGAIINALLLGYAMPAIAAAVLARQSVGVRPIWFSTGAGALSVVLLFTYASLETRVLFRGARICLLEPFGQTETWTYSAVWIVLGLVFLLYGILRKLQGARLASAAFVLLATLKIFLYDLSNLEGLARAFSFIGLGAALIGIGLLYQKFVFRDFFATPASE